MVRTHVDHVCVHRVRVRVRNVFMHVFFLLFCAYPVFTGVALFVRLGGSKGSSQVLKRTNVLYTVTLYRNYWRGREGACVRACVRACMRVWMEGCREGGNAHVQGMTRARKQPRPVLQRGLRERVAEKVSKRGERREERREKRERAREEGRERPQR